MRWQDCLRLRPGTVLMAATMISSGLAAPASPAMASPYHETIITVAGPRTDWISRGYSRFFHHGNSDMDVAWSGGELRIEVAGGNQGEDMRFLFTVPFGSPLQPGTYENGIFISASNRGCNANGRFTIKDIKLSPLGRVDRAWLTFEQRCDTARPMMGEIRYRMPADGGDLLVGPRTVSWPVTERNAPSPVVPVRVVNTASSPVTVGAAVLAGAPDIDIRRDECSGRMLVSNESCSVWVRFSPTTQGLHQATLDVTEPAGVSHRTTFAGNVIGTAGPPPPAGQAGAAIGGGSTVFAYDSDRGDYIGQGRDASYDAADGEFMVFGSSYLAPHMIRAEIDLTNGEHWSIEFQPPEGDILVPGYTHSGATRYPFNGDEAGLSVSGAGRGCNTLHGAFAIHALRVNDFGDVLQFHATFEQHCDGAVPALHGTFRWQHPGPLPSLPPYVPPPPDPVPQTHPRTVTLSIRNRVARGAVMMETTVKECRVGVPVRVQRRVEGRFRTVAEVVTDHMARYEKWVGRRHGVYRAVAPAKQLVTGDTCARAVSASWRY